MDQQKLRSLVFEKTGVKIDVDDPVFALVALNEAVLEETVERHLSAIDEATQELVAAAKSAGGRAPRTSKAAAAALLKETPPPPPPGPSVAEKRMMAIAAGAAVLCALLVLIGQALLFRPAPAAPDAEKLQKAIERLDPKTRAAVEAELKKQ